MPNRSGRDDGMDGVAVVIDLGLVNHESEIELMPDRSAGVWPEFTSAVLRDFSRPGIHAGLVGILSGLLSLVYEASRSGC